MGINGPIENFKLSFDFILLLVSFTAIYFLLNSWLVTLVVAFEEKASPLRIWWTSFTELSVNFAAGASIAAFLVVNADGIDLTFIGVVLPLLLVIYFTYQWSLSMWKPKERRFMNLIESSSRRSKPSPSRSMRRTK